LAYSSVNLNNQFQFLLGPNLGNLANCFQT
jgi:hypothetical protein